MPFNVSSPRGVMYVDARGTVDGVWGSEFLGALVHSDNLLQYFMAAVSEVCAEHLDPSGYQRINQCEAAAALVALSTWGAELAGHWVTLYTDNRAAEGALAKGYSRSRLLANISAAFWQLAEKYRLGIWIVRVPSELNPSDALSRGDPTWAQSVGAAEVKAKYAPAASWGW